MAEHEEQTLQEVEDLKATVAEQAGAILALTDVLHIFLSSLPSDSLVDIQGLLLKKITEYQKLARYEKDPLLIRTRKRSEEILRSLGGSDS